MESTAATPANAAATQCTWGPVQPEERIALLDVLRGLALVGIIVANMRGFAGPLAAYMRPSLLWETRADFWTQAFVNTFVQGKFITVFAFLFGAGFALQMARAEAKQARFAPLYRRRLEALILLGLLHQLLFWWGDILITYGLGGFLLLLFRKRQNKTIAAWVLFLLLLPGAGLSGYILFRQFRPPKPQPEAVLAQRRARDEKETRDEMRKAIDIYQRGDYVEVFLQRYRELPHANKLQPGAVVLTLPIFLLGLLAYRSGIFQDPEKNRRRLRTGLVWGLAIGIPANILTTYLQTILEAQAQQSGRGPTPLMVLNIVLVLLSRPVLSMGYACAVGLLFLDQGWRRRMMSFSVVGRTALSNYLLQSVVCTTIFNGYGLALFGRLHLGVLLVLSLVIYALQVPLSRWWLTRYRFGPAEWLWRTMTYGKQPAMSGKLSVAGG